MDRVRDENLQERKEKKKSSLMYVEVENAWLSFDQKDNREFFRVKVSR